MRRHTVLAGALITMISIAVAPAARAADSTSITFRISRCADCLISAYRVDPVTKQVYKAEPVKVVGKRAQLTVPTEQTRGMVFTVSPPSSWDVITSQPLISVAYKGRMPGEPNTVLGVGRASPCWAGTTQMNVTIPLRSSGPGGLPGGGSMPGFAFRRAGASMPPYIGEHDGGGIARNGHITCQAP